DPQGGGSMVDFRLSEEQESLRKVVEDFARKVVAPRAEQYDQSGEFPYDVVEQMARMGLFGLPFPERYGGMGGDYFTLCLALEELARADSSAAITLEAAVSLGAMPVFRFGTERQRQRWLPELTAGTRLAAFGLTEPGGGADACATRTTARADDRQLVINGFKCFNVDSSTKSYPTALDHVTTGMTALPAVTANGEGGKEISSIIVPSGTPGLTVGGKYSKVGWRASDTRELAFNDLRVPVDNLLGERGRGYAQFLSILDEGRVAIAAIAVGLAQGCVDECVRYARERTAFGHN